MKNLSNLVRQLEQRARHLAGLRASSVALLAASGTGLATAASMYLIPSVVLPNESLAILIAFPVVTAAIAHLIGRSRRSDPAYLLLQVDMELGLEERLSSLYTLRKRGGKSVFRRRLEALLTPLSVDCRRGLPAAKTVRWTYILGFACLAGAVLLGVLRPSPSSLAAQVAVNAETNPTVTTDHARTEQVKDAGTIPSPASLAGADIDFSHRESPTDQFRLEDVLSELRAGNASEPVVGDASPEELAQMIHEQRAAAQQLQEAIESMLKRVQQEGGGLLPEEQQMIRSQLGQTTNPQLVESLLQLITEPGDENLEKLLNDLLTELEAATPTVGADPGGGSQAVPLTQDEFGQARGSAIGADEIPEDSSLKQDVREDGTDRSHSDGNGETGAWTQAEGPPQEGSQAGGEDEMSAGGMQDGTVGEARSTGEQPTFVMEEAPATIGEIGDFTSFITEGVPVELPSQLDPDQDAFIVDFERIQSILHTRGVPEDVVDAVRRYFELITQGGP